jgi:hypothetical protein
MCEEILRERIKKVFEREIDRVEQIRRNIPGLKTMFVCFLL